MIKKIDLNNPDNDMEGFNISFPPGAKEMWERDGISKVKLIIHETSIDISYSRKQFDWINNDGNYIRLIFDSLLFPFIDLKDPYIKDGKSHYHLQNAPYKKKEYPKRFYLIQFFPFNNDNPIPHTVIHGILLSSFGKGILYKKIFENIISLETNEISIRSLTIENPLSFYPQPDPNDDKINSFNQKINRIKNLSSAVQNRVFLSIDWFQKSVLSSNKIDAFISQWVAIECLSEDERKINPLKTILTEFYPEKKHEENLGKIFSLRSNLVHKGVHFSIDQFFLGYLSALYLQLLGKIIGIKNKNETAIYTYKNKEKLIQIFQKIEKQTKIKLDIR